MRTYYFSLMHNIHRRLRSYWAKSSLSGRLWFVVVPQGFLDVFWDFLHGSLCDLHSNSFRQIALNILQINACARAGYPGDLDAPVMRPHLVLHAVLLEDVPRLQQRQLIDVFRRLKYFLQAEAELFGGQRGEELVTVEHGSIVTFDLH